MVFFTWKELVKWLGITMFEMWLHLVAVLMFSVFLALKVDGVLDWSWWIVFSPLFVCNGLCAYFCIIVFIRMIRIKDYRPTFMRIIWSLLILALLLIFEFLYCKTLAGEIDASYSKIYGSIYALLQLVTFKACQIH